MKNIKSILLSFLLLTTACSQTNREGRMQNPGSVSYSGTDEIATIAGGCFWCIESPFEKIDGVNNVISGRDTAKSIHLVSGRLWNRTYDYSEPYRGVPSF